MILVTGATGQIGSKITEGLIQSKADVRVFVRDENRLGDLKNENIQVAEGTFEDMESLEKALEGVDRLMLIGQDNPDQVQQHLNVIQAAKRQGVKHIVKLSAFGADKNSPVALMRDHAEIEDAIKDSGMEWTFIRPHLYMQNLLRFGDSVAENNTFLAPMAHDAYPLVDIRDVAEVAATILTTENHNSKIYTLTSPHAENYDEIAETLSSLLGKTITYQAQSPEDFESGLLESGTPEWRAYDLAYISKAYKGSDKHLITSDIEDLLGRPARSVKDFLSDHLSTFKN